MLVLTRKVDEYIVVDGPCLVKLVDIRGDMVRLGISAHQSNAIHRSEIAEDITGKTESEMVALVLQGKRAIADGELQ